MAAGGGGVEVAWAVQALYRGGGMGRGGNGAKASREGDRGNLTGRHVGNALTRVSQVGRVLESGERGRESRCVDGNGSSWDQCF